MKKDDSVEARLRDAGDLDQIDSLFVVSKPVFWMALVTVGILAASLALWGVFGVMSTTVSGVGLLLDSGGVSRVVHDSSGRVAQILVSPGDRVRKGDVVARLEQPLLDSEIILSREYAQRSSNYQEALKNQSSFDSAAVKKDIAALVICPADGVVAEIQVNAGDYVAAGVDSVCTIRKDRQLGEITAVMYFPVDEAKKIQAGMVARLVPSEADYKKDGYLLGIVRTVGDYPVTTAAVTRSLGNAELAGWLQSKVGGAAVEVSVDPMRSDSSPSGYLWTSVVGNPPLPKVGSFCSGEVVVRRLTPIQRLFYRMGEYLKVF